MSLAAGRAARPRPVRSRRLPTRPSPWPGGSQVLLRHVSAERTWCLLPVTVLYDDGQRFVFRIQVGTTWLAAVRPGGGRAHGWHRRWRLTATRWSGHDGTYVVDRGRWYGIVMFTDPATGELVKWYVNAQDPIQRRPWGFDTMDRELDVEVPPHGGTARWKDQHRLAKLVAEGVTTPLTARRLMHEARHAVGHLAEENWRVAMLRWTRPPMVPLDVQHLIDRLAPVPGAVAVGGPGSRGAVGTREAAGSVEAARLAGAELPPLSDVSPQPGHAAPVLIADDLTPRHVYVAAGRARRPVSVAAGCPFCPGGREVPADFETAAFPNRWPPIAPDRCEVLVHSPHHDEDFATMSPQAARRVVDLWAWRGAALADLDDVRCVLVFENRGAVAGATVEHPHSQVFALPVTPPLVEDGPPAALCPACARPDAALLIEEATGWRAAVPTAPPSPYAVRLTAPQHVASLAELDAAERDGLAGALVRTVRRLDALFHEPMPYQLWTTRPAHGEPGGHLSVTVAGLLRSPGRPRILGAAELATGLYFTPVGPAEAAAALRAAAPQPHVPEVRR
ncbi:DUF4931 domain-containing protein [Streptomyces sp. NPDC058252]|uniref:DUF4931 domain-containing protein n=1 Tax=Streptomyces sp. NPDC058252 TaxID=3346405 RepID=UPI0036E8DC23